MSSKLLIVLLAAPALLHVCAAGPVIDWLKANKDTTRAAELLQTLYKKEIPANAKFTLFAPTNSAIEAFRRDMQMTPAQFADRTGLLDLVVAYHIIPGYAAKELKVNKSPAIAATGDINYILKFVNTDKGVTAEDLQGNRVALSKPVVIGNAAIIVVDKVFMSGSYFFDGNKALSYYPIWSEAKEFAKTSGYPDGTGREQDMTFFVPDNDGMDAAKPFLSKLTDAQKKEVFLNHITNPARSVPSDFKVNKLTTNLKGSDLTVNMVVDSSKVDEVTGKPNQVPTVSLTSNAGWKANINIFNVFVGKSVWQGIDSVLVPKFGDGKVQTEAGGKRNRRMLLSWAAEAIRTGGRSLLRNRDSGQSQMYANTVASENTSRAIEAAATGAIPTSYATKYGSFQAQSAAQYGDCFNCNNWA